MNINRIPFLMLIIVFGAACNSSEAPKSNTKVTQKASIDSFPFFKIAFEALDFSDSTIRIHHWNWDNPEDSTYFGQRISSTLLQSNVDTSFQFFEDDEYYAVGTLPELNAYLIRSRSSEADYMQELFLFIFNDKNTCTDWKKVASFYGAEGFINQSASWLSKANGRYSLVMRNYNWSISMPSGKEKKAEEIRKYIFSNHQFEVEDTHFIKPSEKKKYPFIGE